jgi:hypothetical protein
MKKVPIDLSEPFEEVLARALSLPRTDHASASDAVIKRAMRSVYEAANGRIVETDIGAIPIAPPVKPSLKEKPLCLKSTSELLTMVRDNLGSSDNLNYAGPTPQNYCQANTGSAMTRRLVAPEWWERNDAACANGAARDVSGAISRWENEGGKRCPQVHQSFPANTTAIQFK